MPRLCEVSSWSARRLWWSLAAAFFVAIAAWSLGTPLMTGHDEAANAIRAAAVVRGDVFGGPSAVLGAGALEVRVPEAFARAHRSDSCFIGETHTLEPIGSGTDPGRTDCPGIGEGSATELALTNQYRHQPVFHSVVGLPSRVFPNELGAYLMRLVGAAIGAAFLASAAASARCFGHRSLVGLALLCTVTPEVLYLAATINTAGPEVTAVLAALTTGLALSLGDDEIDARLVTRLGVALVALALSRALSLLFVLVVIAVIVLTADHTRRRRLTRRTDVRVWLGATGLAMVASAAWILYVQRRFPLPAREGTGLHYAVGRIDWWLREAVGIFGSTDVVPPVLLHVLWGCVAVAILGIGLLGAAPRDRALVGVMVIAALALLVSGEGLSIPDTGYWWQGRYVLPLLTGALLTAAAARRPMIAVRARLGIATSGVLIVLHLWAFLYAARHYAVGYGGTARPWRFLTTPVWSPPSGPAAVWAVALVSGLAAAHLLVLGSVDGVRSPAALDSPAPAALGMAR